MTKKAQPIREDHLELAEKSLELRKRIQKIYRLKSIPSPGAVQRMLSQLESLKQTGLIK